MIRAPPRLGQTSLALAMQDNPPDSGAGQPPIECDVAVVGGGPGGLYAAWRLRHTQPSLSIAIFEATSRVGGRVRTLNTPDIPFTMDIGAMRFLREQVFVNALVKYFQLPTFEHPVPVASYFLRNAHLLPRLNSGHLVQYDPQRQEVVALSAFNTRSDARPIDVSPGEIIQCVLWRILSKVEIDADCLDAPSREFLEQHPERVVLEPFLQEVRLDALGERIRRLRTSSNDRLKEKRFDYFTVPEWIVIKKFGRIDGRRLYEYSLWELVERELGAETFRLARACLGYQTIFGAWNAAEHIPWFIAEFGSIQFSGPTQSEAPPSPAVAAIRGGMQRLVDAIKVQLGGVAIHTDATVSSMDGVVDGRIKMQMRSRGGGAITVLARKVICAVSRGALERISWPSTFRLDPVLATQSRAAAPAFGECLNVVVGNPLMKVFALYERPWVWELASNSARLSLAKWDRVRLTKRSPDLGQSSFKIPDEAEFVGSRIITDLPVRQLYFHGPADGWWNPKAKLAGRICGMVMAYCDARESEYWARIWRRARSGKTESFSDLDVEVQLSDESRQELAEHGVSHDFVEVFERNVRAAVKDLFGGDAENVPRPVLAFFQNWSAAPYFGGWHAWNMGCDPQAVRHAIQKPFSNAEVYVCGEAFSSDQGWIEGALRTSESMLQRHFSVPFDVTKDLGLTLARELELSHYSTLAGRRQRDFPAALKLYLNW